jgi:PAS domain S-box-containing protein
MKTDPEAKGNRDSDKLIADKKSPPPVSESTGKSAQPKRRKPLDALFTNIIEKINEGFVALDAHMNYVYINERGSELLGRKPADLIGKNYWEEYPQDINTSFGKAYLQALETQIPAKIEDYYEARERWFENRIYPSEGGLSIFFNDITGRKQTERILREKDEQLRRITEVTPILFSECSRDLKYLFVNRAAAEFLGLPPEEIVGQPIRLIMGDEAFEKVLPYIERTLKGERVEYELEIPYRGAGRRFMQAIYIPKMNEAGVVSGWLATVTDITEHKGAEEALRQSEERFARFMQHLPGLAWIKDLQGRYVFANAAAEKAFNTPQDKLYGNTDQDIVPAETAAQFMRNDRQALAEGTGVQVIETLQQEDGVLHYSLVSKFPIPGPDGNIALVGGTAFDITELKRAEEALQQLNLELEERVQKRTAELRNVNSQLLQEIKERTIVEGALRESDETTRLILDTAPDVIVIANKQGQIMRVNAQIEKLFGYRAEQVIGKPIETLIPPRFHGRHIEHRAYYSSNPHRRPMGLGMELFGQRKDGTEFSVDVMLTPIHNIADWNTMVTIRDSTERKQMEDALRESHKRLQSLSKRLVEVQEEERRAIARELHDRVGQSLAALNLNLTIVNNQLSSLVNEQVNARLSDSLDLVAELIALVRDVMSNLRPAVLDDYGLEAALQTNLDSFKARYGIAITFEKNQSLIPRLGSSIEMTLLRIAQEAMLNVVRHAQADQVTLSLQMVEQVIRMTVQDNGVGLQSWQTAHYPGSHGLMIMRERAEAVGGNLRVSSTPGKGTRIEASIPFQEKASEEQHQ